MFHGFLNRFFRKSQPVATPRSQPEISLGSAKLSQCVVFGNHRYRTATEDSTVYFIDESRGLRRMLVDSIGNIRNFPGILREDFWVRQVSPRALKPQIRFRTDFVIREGRFAMLWQIQPEGRYWEDSDGFGGTNDEDVILYAFLDENGSWDGPFRIYSIGETHYI